MSYLLFAIARLLGRSAAPRIERKWQDSTMDPEKLASRRNAEAMLPDLKQGMGPDGWAFVTEFYQRKVGALLPEWRVAELHLADTRAESRSKAAEYQERVAAVFDPLVPELKASMTPEEWEERRARLARSWRVEREIAARQWRAESVPCLPPGASTTPPWEHDGGELPEPKDWQIAQELHPIPLDLDGRPRDAG
jgi:hypothetical protein